MAKKRVLIGMSGGIDSTVAAILLLEQGYELVGATFRTFDVNTCQNKEKGCCSEDSITEAQQMAAKLGFEHHILDFRKTFRKHVIDNFVQEYACGRTPNNARPQLDAGRDHDTRRKEPPGEANVQGDRTSRARALPHGSGQSRDRKAGDRPVPQAEPCRSRIS